jgi:hypothetical protein
MRAYRETQVPDAEDGGGKMGWYWTFRGGKLRAGSAVVVTAFDIGLLALEIWGRYVVWWRLSVCL